MLKDLLIGREPRHGRRSLRSELLFNLAFLAAAALCLALWTASVLRLSTESLSGSIWLLALLVLLDLLIFILLGNHLVNRLVLRPLAETAGVAEAIAAGDYERRVPEGDVEETASLAISLNRLTDQLLQNQLKLAENVESLDEANQELHRTQRELVQAEKMASIGRFAAGIAHEVGNPLGALMGYAGVLRRRGTAEPEVVEGIEREARRIDRIVRGLLEYARPGTAPRERVDVHAAVRRVMELLRGQGRLERTEVRLELEAEGPEVEAVPHRVDQMFVNLFTNAIAAMEGAGVLTVVTRRELYEPDRGTAPRRADDPPGVNYSHLRRSRHATARDASTLAPGREVIRVVVADTGPGIPPENIRSIFDPFFTTKAPGEGTGLGLAIVASTVAELGGRIEASSAEGGGATFHMFLPAAEVTG